MSLSVCSASNAFAGSATWASNPSSGDWNTATNWSPATVPDGSSDIATFATSSTTSVSLAFDVRVVVDAIVFNSGASPFTISHRGVRDHQYFARRLSIQGNGIINNSGITQNFVAEEAPISFRNGATAGDLTHFTLRAGPDPDTFSSYTDSFCSFWETSSAGNAAFTLDGGQVYFRDNSTAANAVITVNGGFRTYGIAQFSGNSTAGNATLFLNGPPLVDNEGFLIFVEDATGGSARVVFGDGTGPGYNGVLVIDNHNAPGVAVGSIEGNGYVSLGSNNLTVGSNQRSTIFTGRIFDNSVIGGAGGGSFTKTGAGKLNLTDASTYTGGTSVNGGVLLVKNKGGSATGTGAVQVNAGRLRGTGKIAGAVTVGNGCSSGAILVGGESVNAPGTLTINNALTFNFLSTNNCVLKRSTPKASKVSAVGVTINSTAQFVFVDPGTGALPAGTVFTVIDNASSSPILGRFSNLSDGMVFTSNGTSFKVSYTGGTGNDLTLTVQ